MTGSFEGRARQQRVEAAAARAGVHAGLFDMRATTVVKAMLDDELGVDADACAAEVDLLVTAVGTKLAARATKGPVDPATFEGYVVRLSAAGPMAESDARWALATWVGAASGHGPDPALLAGPPSTPTGRAASRGTSRRPLVLAAVAVVVVALGAVAAVVIANRSGSDGNGPSAEQQIAERWDGVGPGNPGPFSTGAAFIDAIPVPKTFTRLSPDDSAEFADAEYVVTADFDTTCADLGRALQAMEPTFPLPQNQEYPTGGVSRCEAQGPVASLGGTEVRALVLKIDNRVQIYVDDPNAGATIDTTETTDTTAATDLTTTTISPP